MTLGTQMIDQFEKLETTYVKLRQTVGLKFLHTEILPHFVRNLLKETGWTIDDIHSDALKTCILAFKTS